MVPLLLMEDVYWTWRLTSTGRIETASWHFGGSRPSVSSVRMDCYWKTFSKGEMKMLQWLLEELSEYWDDPYNDWTPGVQKYLGDIVYNKLGER